MKRSLGFAILLALATQLRAETWVKYEAEAGSKVKIDGTSTIHDWTMEGQIIGGFLEADVAREGDALKAVKINKAEVSIPVRSLQSTGHLKPERMNEVMRENMKATQHKAIQYKLSALEPKKAPSAAVPFQFEATGLLTIAGVTRTNKMQVNVEAPEKNKLKIIGNTTVKMTDFGVTPPAPSILGMSPIKTGDEVKVHVEWMTGPAAEKK